MSYLTFVHEIEEYLLEFYNFDTNPSSISVLGQFVLRSKIPLSQGPRYLCLKVQDPFVLRSASLGLRYDGLGI